MLIIGNWKAYIEKKDQVKGLVAAAKKLAVPKKHTIAIAPSFPHLGFAAAGTLGSVRLAAQDISDTTGGAETGEVTAAALKNLGVTYAIIGHSERRRAGDTDVIVASKVRHALAHGLAPVVCIGEAARDPDALYLQQLRAQISAVYEPLTAKERLVVIIAYEPLWAIGPTATGAITPYDLEEMVRYIRKILAVYMPGCANEKTQILYGGSADATNAHELTHGTGVDGLLPGRASTDPKAFTALVKAV